MFLLLPHPSRDPSIQDEYRPHTVTLYPVVNDMLNPVRPSYVWGLTRVLGGGGERRTDFVQLFGLLVTLFGSPVSFGRKGKTCVYDPFRFRIVSAIVRTPTRFYVRLQVDRSGLRRRPISPKGVPEKELRTKSITLPTHYTCIDGSHYPLCFTESQ